MLLFDVSMGPGINKANSRLWGDVVSTEAWSGLEQLAKNAYSIITYHLHGLIINTYVKF